MKKLSQKLYKVLSVISGLSLVLNSVLPASIVFAQEVTPEPTPVETIAPTPEPTVSPEVTPETTVEPTQTPVPTEETTPVPTPEEVTPTPSEVAQPSETGPPAEGQILDGATTQATTATPTVIPEQPKETGELQALVLENVKAESLDLENVDPTNSATLTTDKADYAPTDTAIITGTDFLPNHTYALTISSNDQPTTSTTVDVTTDDDGSFIYAYQLDGTYRPDYSVVARDSGSVIAEVSFTDAPTSGTTIDSAGADDEPGQKDLTLMFADYAGLPNSVAVKWNWDEIKWTGNNTGDGCALFDTDGDGLVNYSLCVIISGNPASYQSKALYSCGDNAANKCTSPVTTIVPSANTTCTAAGSTDDPFPDGDEYPKDTKAQCTISLADVGGAGIAQLVDVCSYPSQQPNSDPSDCIVFRPSSGKIEVIKNLIPTSDTGKFNLQINDTTFKADAGNGDSTGEQVVDVGSNTFGETAGTGTNLTQYASSVECKDLNGTGVVVPTTGSGPWSLDVEDGKDIVCTITNTLQNGTIVVHKDVQGPGGEAVTDTSANFTVALDGSNPQLITDNGTVTYLDVAAGTHAITETVIPVGYTLYSILPVQATVVAGQTTDVYVVNRQQSATVTIHKNVINPDGGEVADTHSFTVQKGGAEDKTIAEGTDAVYTVAPGTYTFTEVSDANYILDSITGDNDGSAANGATITVAPAGSAELTFVNKQKKATIIVTKDVTKSDGSAVSDNNTFAVTLDGQTKDFSENTPAVFTVNPGTYSAVESAEPNYTEVSNDSPETVVSNGQGTINIVNKQNPASISGFKFKADGVTGIAGWTINLFSCVTFGVSCNTFVASTTTAVNGFYSFTNLVTGFYQVVEDLTNPNYTPIGATSHDVSLTPGSTSQNNNFSNFANIDITVCKAEDADGNVQTTGDQTPVVGWEIRLIKDANTNNPTIGRTSTNGCYVFTNLGPAQNYTAVEIMQAGWTNLTPTSHDFGVPQDGVDQTYTFVNFENVSLSGSKFSDPNHNGVWDQGEHGLANWSIGLAPTGLSTVTNQNGDYSFANLGPGTYTISETQQAGWDQTYPSNPNTHTVTVSSGQNVENLDFGNFEILPGLTNEKLLTSSATAMEGDTVTFTITAQNTGNVTLYNAIVTDTYDSDHLTYVSSSPISADSQSSAVVDSGDYDNDGNTTEMVRTLTWNIGDLDPGETYTLTLTFTALLYTEEPTVTGNVASTTSCLSDVTTCSEEDTVDAGETEATVDIDRPGSVSGQKFVDTNGNGDWDNGENTLNDVTIELRDGEGGLLDTTTTAGTGAYTFTGLVTGDYQTCEIAPTGYVQTYPNGCHEFSITDDGETVEHKDFGNQGQGTITVVKQTDPNESQQSFEFSSSYGTNFFLTDDASNIAQNIPAGTYSVTEITPEGWDLTNAVCSDQSPVNAIDLQPGESVTCTFTNTQRGEISGYKYDDTNGDGVDSGDWTPVSGWVIELWQGLVKIGETVTDGNGYFSFTNLVNGTYNVIEAMILGWTNVTPTTVNVTLDPGESDQQNNFVNTQYGTIIVQKQTLPDGSQQTFDFDLSYGDGDADLSDNQEDNSGDLLPGTYSVAENTPEGWDLTNVTCSDRSNPNEIHLSSNETVTCVFTNTQRGQIIVDKVTDPTGDTQSFVFTPNYGNAFSLNDEDTPNTSGYLVPGSYSVSETPEEGWDLTSATCSDQSPVDAIDLQAGETVTCTFTNQKDAHIIIAKESIPDGSEQEFEFETSYGSNFLLTDGQSNNSGDLTPGIYSVNELAQTGWTLDTVSCDDESVPSAMDLQAGETITCTFNNSRDTGTIIVHKIIDTDGNLETTEDQLPGEGWEMGVDGFEDASDFFTQFTDATGSTTFSPAKTGNYNVREIQQAGYDLLTGFCDNGQYDDGIVFMALGTDETVNCTFINSPNGTIHGQKWNDLNGNGEFDRGEEYLSGWKIFIDENENQTWDEGELFDITDTGEELGWYSFNHLFPGTYTVCEELVAGWAQTSSPTCHTVQLPQGENTCTLPEVQNNTFGAACNFGNQELDPILTITKENNTGGGNKRPGENVVFTITVTATQSAAFNVTVTDLLAAGFVYRSGSWTSNSDTRGDIKASGITTEPTYASPGVWQLGDMSKDETVTLTYIADIIGDIQSGTYFDLAWAGGCRSNTDCSVGDEMHVLSNATTPGFVADNYVGTQVRIVREPSEGVNLKHEGQVLGASTELPATGANVFFIYIAFALITGGLTFGALGWFMRRRYE